jgi:tRNA modification GTPase
VANKADLVVDKLWINCESPSSFWISAVDGSGVAALIAALTSFAKDYFAAGESALITRARHRQALEDTMAALDRALSSDARGHDELIAEELRAAATSLGRLTGRVDVEDILDVIFRDFCIGK